MDAESTLSSIYGFKMAMLTLMLFIRFISVINRWLRFLVCMLFLCYAAPHAWKATSLLWSGLLLVLVTVAAASTVISGKVISVVLVFALFRSLNYEVECSPSGFL